MISQTQLDAAIRQAENAPLDEALLARLPPNAYEGLLLRLFILVRLHSSASVRLLRRTFLSSSSSEAARIPFLFLIASFL